MTGNSKKDYKDTIIDFVYSEAIDDATRQKAFNAVKKWMKDSSDNNIARVKTLLKNHINNILDGMYNSEIDYNKAFYDLAHEICKEINNSVSNPKEREFQFGNAQKLINITVKYFYIICYSDDKRDCFRYCHCPVDYKMLQRVWREKGEDLKQNKNGKFKRKYNKTSFCNSWSKIDNDRYDDFQICVKDLAREESLANSIEYDYKHWN